jgi:hypothetical protein
MKTTKPGCIYRVYEIWCGGCGVWLQTRRTLVQTKKWLKDLGWGLDPTVGWLCPRCRTNKKNHGKQEV